MADANAETAQDNQAQIEFWNGEAGDTWTQTQERMDALLQPLSDELLRRAAAQAGERALDVGCGCGATSLALHAAGAAVWGVDVSAPMLVRARERAQGLSDIAFSQTDAATQAYTADHQLVISRFGVMFFDDPVAAFKQLRTALSDDGRLVFLCWQAPRENPWIAIAGRAVQPFQPEPETPIDPRAPGPFAFADREYLQDILQQAGYANISIESYTTNLLLARNLDEAMDFQSRIGPLARGLAEMDEATREQALHAARTALAEHLTDEGLRLGAATWLVTATK